jgi:hypothetical protein
MILAVRAAPALAGDPLAIAKAHDDAFDAATWKGRDPQKGLGFYEKVAIAVSTQAKGKKLTPGRN